MIPPVPVCYRITPANLTASQFQTLKEVLPEIEPFANLTEPNTRQAYHQDIQGFMAFEGLRTPKHFHDATRAHVLVSKPPGATGARQYAQRPEGSGYSCHLALSCLAVGFSPPLLRKAIEESGMRIRSIKVRRFRSIEKTVLTSCGGLDVLIGKNNAGKSNILSTIDLMHTHLSGATIAGSWIRPGQLMNSRIATVKRPYRSELSSTSRHT